MEMVALKSLTRCLPQNCHCSCKLNTSSHSNVTHPTLKTFLDTTIVLNIPCTPIFEHHSPFWSIQWFSLYSMFVVNTSNRIWCVHVYIIQHRDPTTAFRGRRRRVACFICSTPTPLRSGDINGHSVWATRGARAVSENHLISLASYQLLRCIMWPRYTSRATSGCKCIKPSQSAEWRGRRRVKTCCWQLEVTV